MRIGSNSYNFPLKLIALMSLGFGVYGLFAANYWSGFLVILGLYPLGLSRSIELSKDNKVVNFYKIYGFFFKSVYDSILIPDRLDLIFYKKRNYSIRTLGGLSFIPDYKRQSDYWIILVHPDKDKSVKIKFIDYNQGYKVAKFLSSSLHCKLIEKERVYDKIEDDDNNIYTNTKKDRRQNLNMITELTKKNLK